MGEPLSSLSPLRLLRSGVWEFEASEGAGDLLVHPVRPLPVSSLDNRFVATELLLANGQPIIGLLSNLTLAAPELNEHFLTLTVFGSNARRFNLARYHDPGIDAHGPTALAAFLSLELSAVFPIRYDVSGVVLGHIAVTLGTITCLPSKRLSRAEVLALAVS